MPRRNAAVIATPLPDELILLDPATGAMHSLNATGRLVWERLGSATPDAIAASLAAAFDVTAAQAAADVRALLDGLAQAGLVESDADGDA